MFVYVCVCSVNIATTYLSDDSFLSVLDIDTTLYWMCYPLALQGVVIRHVGNRGIHA